MQNFIPLRSNITFNGVSDYLFGGVVCIFQNLYTFLISIYVPLHFLKAK